MSEIENAPETEPNTPEVDEEPRIPRERLNQEATKRKAAEKQLKEMQARLDELEASGLSEVEQTKKRLEAAEKRAQEAEKAREEVERKATLGTRRSWVTEAATEAGFEYPSVAANLDEVDLDAIETADDAARVIKRAAKKYPKLLKAEEPTLPGRVLQNGQAADPAKAGTTRGADEEFARGMLEQINALRSQSTPVGNLFDR